MSAWTLAALLLLGGGSAVAAYRYDRATADRILPGVSIAGVDVGGMSRAQAVDALEEEADLRLEQEIAVAAAGKTWHVTPAELGATADVTAKVDRALDLTQRFGWPARVYRRLLDRPVEYTLDLAYTEDASQIDRFLDLVRRAVRISPRNASVELEDSEVVLRKPKAGRRLDKKAARAAMLEAMAGRHVTAELPVTSTKPKVTAKKLGYSIVVRLSENKLYVYKGMKRKKVYSVATGTAGYPTPKGEWNIWHKAENPTWINPAPNGWGAGMPKSIPGGPNGPLGTRALYLDAPGIRIHGTPNAGSIGTYASHGCIRMLMSDVEELYEFIPIDTKVFII